VVLDTNLFVAAFWNRHSASAEILTACLEGRARPYYTQSIRRELLLILRNIKASESYRQRVAGILDAAVEVHAAGGLSVVADDPDDDKFLECARAVPADYLVTSDDHLLQLGQFGATRILKPTEFRRILRDSAET